MVARAISPGRALRTLVAAMALSCIAACRARVTEMIVVVGTDYAVGTEIDTIHVTVSPTGQSHYFGLVPDSVALGPPGMETRVHNPFSFGVVPREGGIADTMDIVLEAIGPHSETLSTRTVRVGFIAGETHFVRVFLPRTCRAVMNCGTDSTCTETGCQTIAVTTGTVLSNAGVELDGAVSSLDASSADVTDAADALPSLDAADAMGLVDATDVPLLHLTAPRLISPISLSHVPTRAPTLSFLRGGGTATRVEICADRACTSVLQTLDSTASSVRATFATHGVYYWRARGIAAANVGIETSATWQLNVDTGSTAMGATAAWGSVFDVNGDGFADIAASAAGMSAGSGYAYLFYGSRSLVPATPVHIMGSEAPNLANAGDVNGDGFADLAVAFMTAGAADASQHHPGRVDVYFGSPRGINVSSADVSLTLATTTSSYGLGTFVRGAGDVNNDGYADLMVASAAATGTGMVLSLYPGGPGGPSAPVGNVPIPTPISSLGALGDIDGDGFADVAVGDAQATGSPGQIQVGFGAQTSAGWWSFVTLSSDTTSDHLGTSITSAGDMNGDGFPDILMGTGSTTPHFALYPGAQQPVFRSGNSAGIAVPADVPVAASVAAGDVDGDGIPDCVVGGSSGGFLEVGAQYFRGSGNAAFVVTPGTTLALPATLSGYAHFGAQVAIADVNGDGHGDIVVSAPRQRGIAGAVYVFLDPNSMTPLELNSPDSTDRFFGENVSTSN